MHTAYTTALAALALTVAPPAQAPRAAVYSYDTSFGTADISVEAGSAPRTYLMQNTPALHAPVEAFFERAFARSKASGFPPYTTVERAEGLWMDVQHVYGDQLAPPLVSLGGNGGIQFTWETGDPNGERYFEVEVFADGATYYYEEAEHSAGDRVPYGVSVVEAGEVPSLFSRLLNP